MKRIVVEDLEHSAVLSLLQPLTEFDTSRFEFDTKTELAQLFNAVPNATTVRYLWYPYYLDICLQERVKHVILNLKDEPDYDLTLILRTKTGLVTFQLLDTAGIPYENLLVLLDNNSTTLR